MCAAAKEVTATFRNDQACHQSAGINFLTWLNNTALGGDSSDLAYIGSWLRRGNSNPVSVPTWWLFKDLCCETLNFMVGDNGTWGRVIRSMCCQSHRATQLSKNSDLETLDESGTCPAKSD